MGTSTLSFPRILILYLNLKTCLQQIPLIDSISITEEEVYNALLSLDSTKETGIDGISPAVLKNYAIVLIKPLHYLFSYAILNCCLPSEWQIHCIIPIFLQSWQQE